MNTNTRRELIAAGTPGRQIVAAVESLEAALKVLPAGEARDIVAAELTTKTTEAQQVLDDYRAAIARQPRTIPGRIA